ncbi:FadR/GntR family transcriptional regulator [Serinicoccus chungangensis]|uniref:FadR/GntR family transcriptional regulator n=1 Tax=Serinicoccus chungangensis TaxID=767452 RepID=UPI001118FB6A|nr:FCD domain-containing protein [Serinicoccus chungangensis]
MSSSEPPWVRPVRSGNVFEETTEHLLRLLHLGTFPPGAKLPAERELAESLRVSRTTLREVLGELQKAGYVTVSRGRYGGTHVAPTLPPRRGEGALDPAEVDDLLTLRAIVEPAAAGLAAARDLSDEERQRLRDVAADCAAAGVEQYRPLDARLHLTLAELSGSPSLAGVVADVRDRVTGMLDRIPLLPPNLAHSTDQHETVVAAVLAGRQAEAREAMGEHLEGTASLLRGFLS